MISSKEEKIKAFDPGGVGLSENNLFGLPYTAEEADVVILPVPWEVTCSYRTGAAAGPAAIWEASKQVDLYDSIFPDFWKFGAAMLPIPTIWESENERLRPLAYQAIAHLSSGGRENAAEYQKLIKEVNAGSHALNRWVQRHSSEWTTENKIVGVLGGEHSVPLGLVFSLAEQYENFGVLQIDAHADLRTAYEGFEFSHASIMHHIMQIPQVSKLVQVGIRDFSADEAAVVRNSKNRIKLLEMRDLRKQQFQGSPWHSVCKSIIDLLPQYVYISFDIDGLDPALCPDTGTPVPDGFSFEEASYLIEWVVRSGRQIIGFDLCEVVGGEKVNSWNAIVGARILYRLCIFSLLSQPQHQKLINK